MPFELARHERTGQPGPLACTLLLLAPAVRVDEPLQVRDRRVEVSAVELQSLERWGLHDAARMLLSRLRGTAAG